MHIPLIKWYSRVTRELIKFGRGTAEERKETRKYKRDSLVLFHPRRFHSSLLPLLLLLLPA